MRGIRISLVAVGVAMMCFAVVSAVTSSDFAAPGQLKFLAAVLVLHDGLLLPAFLIVGALVHRFVPARERAVVQGGLIVTAAVTFVALPFVLGYGRVKGLPSALPRNYSGGLALILGSVWLVAVIMLVARHVHDRRSPPAAVPARRLGRNLPMSRTEMTPDADLDES